MKNIKAFSLVLSMCLTGVLFSQNINYKALIKDGSGELIANQTITIQFTVLQGVAMTNVYQETHNPDTDNNSIVIVNIGDGTVDSGVFADIDWGSDEHYLNVQIDTGSGLTDMGTTQFMAVPYALHASRLSSDVLSVDQLADGKSDNDGSENGSSIYLGINAGMNDDETDNLNTGIGFEALKENTSGFRNTALGHHALTNNSLGWNNTAQGYEALLMNSVGNCNTAFGSVALRTNSTGIYNTAIGNRALYSNTNGYNNLGNGYSALSLNTTGYENTANGTSALFTNSTGHWNTANGFEAMYNNTTGNNNSANGYRSLYNNLTGNYNTASGFSALSENTTGTNNTAIGYNAQVPDGTLDNQIRIGNEDVTYAGVQVSWTITSDKRWKENIRALPYGLDLVKQLIPVDYIRKNNTAKKREIGFIAQDVDALLKRIEYEDQGIVSEDSKGMLSLRYDDFIALLTKAIQEQQEIIEGQDLQIRALVTQNEKNKEDKKLFEERLSQIELLLKTEK